jgi:hypothetical protein
MKDGYLEVLVYNTENKQYETYEMHSMYKYISDAFVIETCLKAKVQNV